MQAHRKTRCAAFEGHSRIASGELADVAPRVKQVIDRGRHAPILIFDDATSELVEVDFRGSRRDVLKRLADPPAGDAKPSNPPPNATTEPSRSPGRPKLGVVAREVTLLPRHWDWLNVQPGGASVALRKLVEDARRSSGPRDRVRRSQESAYRFMSAIAGNLPGFEEAARALFAGDKAGFHQHVGAWPADVRDHAARLASDAL